MSLLSNHNKVLGATRGGWAPVDSDDWIHRHNGQLLLFFFFSTYAHAFTEGFMASRTIHKFFKLSLRAFYWDSCLSLCHLHCDYWKNTVKIHRVYLLLLQYTCSAKQTFFSRVPTTMATIAVLGFFLFRFLSLSPHLALFLPKSIKKFDGHALHYRDRNGFHIQPNNVHEQ